MRPERRIRLSVTDAGQLDRPGGGSLDYDYRRECALDFDETVAAVEDAIARHGFTVRSVHDIQATLAAKGFRIKPIRMYEVVGPRDPGFAETDARLARLMPCRINVFEEEGSVVVTALRPSLLCRVFPEDDLDEPAAALERVLVAVVDDSVGC